MFRIKVCGVTSADDAVMAAESGADAVGINFFRDSVRYVAPREAAPIVEAVRGRAIVIAVFVDETPETIAAVCGDLGIERAQLSGNERADVAARIRLPVIKAVHMDAGTSLEAFRHYPCSSFLLDAAADGAFGGTGRTHDWKSLEREAGGPILRFGGEPGEAGRPWILAGGLTPDNVGEAIRTARPFGVDVASGVESSPGRKDPRKTKAFVENAREGFKRAGVPE